MNMCLYDVSLSKVEFNGIESVSSNFNKTDGDNVFTVGVQLHGGFITHSTVTRYAIYEFRSSSTAK